MAKTRLELRSGTSNKFWEIAVKGSAYTVRYGRIGAKGTTSTKAFVSPAKAEAAAAKLVEAKRKKGYTAPGCTAAPAPKKKAPKANAKRAERRRAVLERIRPYVGARCAALDRGEYREVLFFDWTKVSARAKAEFFDSVLGDVEGPDSFPDVVLVEYEELGDGQRAIQPRWNDERFLPIAFDGTTGTKFENAEQPERILFVDLDAVRAKKMPVYGISIDGTLVTDFARRADDLSKLGFVTFVDVD